MISNEELHLMKARMLLAADAANKIVNSPDTVRYDEEEYWRVRHALDHLERDVTALMAEVDVWRGMFDERIKLFIQGGLANEGGSGGNGSDAGNDVPGVEVDRAGGGSGEVLNPVPEAGGDVPAERPRRRRKPRSKPRGNTPSSSADTGQLDSGAGESAVGGDADESN